MEIIKGPDFPTGGVALDQKGIEEAFRTGRGKVVVRAAIDFEQDKSKNNIIITEIPYEVLKVNIVKKIDEIRIDKKIDGILEVRDESDKDGLRIVIELKKEANRELILNYLYKNTELQVNYNYNMIAICNRRPKLLGIIEILDSYIAFQKEFILNRTRFDLEHAKKRFHIVEGLIKAISILDEVIRVIRQSKNKIDAKENLVKEFDFTMEQAEAIVVLQLYRLTNTDVTLLEEELKSLEMKISALTKILEDEAALKYIMKKELRAIRDEYNEPRKTKIEATVEEIKIDEEAMIPKEDVIVLVTKDGYVKRTSKRGYNSNTEEPLLKENDYIIGLYELNTVDTVLMFTNLGNYLYIPVYEIPDIKWKQLGKHVSNIIKITEDEEIISVIPVTDFSINKEIIIASKLGMIKKTKLEEFKVSRYSKAISCMKLKEKDTVVAAFLNNYDDIIISTKECYSLWFSQSEIPSSGIKSSGVKAITLKNDVVISAEVFDSNLEYVTVFSDKETGKRVKLTEFEKTSRARRGLLILREIKSNPHKILKVFVTDSKALFGLKKDNEIERIKNTELPITDRYKAGSIISKKKVLDVFEVVDLIKKEELKDIIKEEISEEKQLPTEEKKYNQISLLEIDDKLNEIDDFLKY